MVLSVYVREHNFIDLHLHFVKWRLNILLELGALLMTKILYGENSQVHMRVINHHTTFEPLMPGTLNVTLF
jgi:hypothetical protein